MILNKEQDQKENTEEPRDQDTEAGDAGENGEAAVKKDDSGKVPETTPEEEIIQIKASEFAKLKAERDDYYDKLLRKHAEFDNYRKRILKEFAEMRFEGFREFASEIISSLDDFSKAIESGNTSKDFESFFSGVMLIEKNIKKSLEKFNITEIDAMNKEFDPLFHDALLMEERDDIKEGQIVIDVFQKGYMYRDTVIKHAKVKVGTPKKKN